VKIVKTRQNPLSSQDESTQMLRGESATQISTQLHGTQVSEDLSGALAIHS